MSLPSLFLRIQDPALKEAIASCQELHKFRLYDTETDDDWIDHFVDIQPDVAIVEVAHFTHADYQRLSDIEAIYDMDLIIISSGAPNENLDKLMNLGAIFHYRKPVDLTILSDTLTEVSQYYQHKQEQGRKVATSDLDQFGLLVGSSSPMHQLYRMIRRVAKTEANVLIVGESGSGKELVAQTIHLASERKQQPLLPSTVVPLAQNWSIANCLATKKAHLLARTKLTKGYLSKPKAARYFWMKLRRCRSSIK